jgi:23S rRNA (cytosine1962-C5)-methyltransferase
LTNTVAEAPSVFMLPGRDRRVRGGHPWVYSNEIRMTPEAKALAAGTVTRLRRADGKPLGVGTFNARALIAYRQFSPRAETVVDGNLIGDRLMRALALRKRLFAEPYYRLVHGEADGLPGLIVDRFADTFVVQTGTAGTEALLANVVAALNESLGAKTVVLRNDGSFRRLEGLDSYVRVAMGEIREPVEVIEGGLRFPADVMAGQKTGWYFDQSASRAFVAPLAAGASMLDIYCYTGAFAVAAAAARARAVLGVDSSREALSLARRAADGNGVGAGVEFERGDAFGKLAELAHEKRRFRVVVADPPSFVRSRGELKSGLRGYRKLAHLASALVEDGGFLFIASCSHNVPADAFASEVALGITRAGRQARIIRAAAAGPDHPVHPFLAETAYLKSLVLQID